MAVCATVKVSRIHTRRLNNAAAGIETRSVQVTLRPRTIASGVCFIPSAPTFSSRKRQNFHVWVSTIWLVEDPWQEIYIASSEWRGVAWAADRKTLKKSVKRQLYRPLYVTEREKKLVSCPLCPWFEVFHVAPPPFPIPKPEGNEESDRQHLLLQSSVARLIWMEK